MQNASTSTKRWTGTRFQSHNDRKELVVPVSSIPFMILNITYLHRMGKTLLHREAENIHGG